MKQASEQYREEMKFPFRGQWLVNLYIGFIQEGFQASGVIDTDDEISFLSQNYKNYMFANRSIDTPIATFEKDMFKADGSYQFMDEAHTGITLSYYGIISESLSNEDTSIDFAMTFTSDRGERDLKGLTLYFNDTYPTLFNISTYKDGVQIFTKDYTNGSLQFETTDVFGTDADTMTIHIKKMNKPYVRFRMSYVLFGVGVSFTNDNFLSNTGNFKAYSHPCSVDLPTKDLDMTFDNYDGSFDLDRKGSLINLATIGQDVSLQVGYVREDGVTESLPSEKLELSSFDVDGTSLKIKAVDFLRNENESISFDDPSIFNDRTTLYDIGMVLKKSVKNENFEVILDDSLKDVPIKYTAVDTSCKEAFMMLAGAGRCMMSLTEKGLVIRRTDYDKSQLSISSSSHVPYSNPSQILTPDTSIPWGSFELNRVRADGLSVFPSSTPHQSLKSGYISEALSDKNGNYTEAPYFDIISQEAISTDYLTVVFNGMTPRDITIETYYNDDALETVEMNNIKDSTLNISYSFVSFNKMRIKINSIYEPYRRVYVDYVSFDKYVYELDYGLCIEKPKADVEDMVRNIIVYYSHLEPSKEQEGEYELIENSVTIPCNSKGSDIEYENPFVTTEEVAMDVGQWLKDYYMTQIFYEVSLVGDPTMEVDDVVKVPSDYDDNVLCDIEENEIDFSNGGIRGKIRARRRNNGLVRAKSRLAVY